MEALRQPPPGTDWGVWTTTILGAASFGLLPLLIWPAEFRESTTVEAGQLEAAANWARQGNANPRLASRLIHAARATQAGAFFGLLPVLLGLYVAAMFFIEFTHRPFNLSALLDLTYRNAAPPEQPPASSPEQPPPHLRSPRQAPSHYTWPRYEPAYSAPPVPPPRVPPPPRPETSPVVSWPRVGPLADVSLWEAWCIVLSTGYVLHWIQVRRHARAVRRFSGVFHAALPDGAPPVLMTARRGTGIWPLGIVAAVAFAHFGAWWGIPMLFAAGARRRYARQTGRALRGSIAARMDNVVTSFNHRLDRSALAFCPARGCGAPLSLHARFCPRCGTALTPASIA